MFLFKMDGNKTNVVKSIDKKFKNWYNNNDKKEIENIADEVIELYPKGIQKGRFFLDIIQKMLIN